MKNLTKESRAAVGNILIVEDSPTQAAQLQFILEKARLSHIGCRQRQESAGRDG